MAKSKEDIDTKDTIKLFLGNIEKELTKNEVEHKDIGGKIDKMNKVLIGVRTALVGFNGTAGALDEVKKNTVWRLEITGALKLLYILVGTNCLVVILRILKVI